jgi:cell division protein ZapA
MEIPPQTVNVRIYNQTYNIRASDGNVERTLQLAEFVDARMREITHGALTADSLKVAILTALHLADELDKANSKYDELNASITKRSGQCVDMLDQMLK